MEEGRLQRHRHRRRGRRRRRRAAGAARTREYVEGSLSLDLLAGCFPRVVLGHAGTSVNYTRYGLKVAVRQERNKIVRPEPQPRRGEQSVLSRT